MLVTQKMVGLPWISVRDRFPLDGHECALSVVLPDSCELRRAIGCRLNGNWKIQDSALARCDVRAWLELPVPTESSV
jgi:hypothetical protein